MLFQNMKIVSGRNKRRYQTGRKVAFGLMGTFERIDNFGKAHTLGFGVDLTNGYKGRIGLIHMDAFIGASMTIVESTEPVMDLTGWFLVPNDKLNESWGQVEYVIDPEDLVEIPAGAQAIAEVLK